MTRAARNVARLRRLLPTIKLLGKDGQWLAGALQEYLAGAARGMTLDQALGVSRRPGSRPWWREEALRHRDAAIRQLAQRHFADMELTDRARAIARAASRYETGAWRFDRQKMQPPPHYRNTAQEFLFLAFHAAGELPGWRRIAEIIAETQQGRCDEIDDLAARELWQVGDD